MRCDLATKGNKYCLVPGLIPGGVNFFLFSYFLWGRSFLFFFFHVNLPTYNYFFVNFFLIFQLLNFVPIFRSNYFFTSFFHLTFFSVTNFALVSHATFLTSNFSWITIIFIHSNDNFSHWLSEFRLKQCLHRWQQSRDWVIAGDIIAAGRTIAT